MSENLNILISCGSNSWGGLEIVTLQTALILKNQGNSLKLLCPLNSKLEKEAYKSGIITFPLNSVNKKIPSSIYRLNEEINRFNPDVIHTHLSHDLWTITPALNLAGSKAKLYLTKHMASGVKKTDLFHRYLYKRLNGIFCVSNYIRESVINTCPVPIEKIHLLSNGIGIKHYEEKEYNIAWLKKHFGIPENKIVISIIGRMTPGKGHEEFLNAIKIINEKYSGKIFFVIAGSASYGEEKYETKIRNIAKELGYQNMIFTGYVQDVRNVLALTDILAFPSHNESFGVTLLEAMAMNVPVAASGYAGVLDIVTDNETGLLFEPKNHNHLADALIKLINDKPLRTRLAEAGKKIVTERFNIESIIIKLIEYYNS